MMPKSFIASLPSHYVTFGLINAFVVRSIPIQAKAKNLSLYIHLQDTEDVTLKIVALGTLVLRASGAAVCGNSVAGYTVKAFEKASNQTIKDPINWRPAVLDNPWKMPANHTVTVQKTIGYENTQIPPADLIQWIKNHTAQLRGNTRTPLERRRRLSTARARKEQHMRLSTAGELKEQHRRLSTGSIYGLPRMNLQYFAIEHIFIMVPPVDGWYTVNLTKSDDASYLAIRSPTPRRDSSENGQPYRMPQTWGDMVRDDLQRNAFQQKYIRRLLKGSDTGLKGMRFFAQAGHPVMFNYKSANVMGGPFAARIKIRDSQNRLILGDQEPEISNCIFTEPCMDIPLGHLEISNCIFTEPCMDIPLGHLQVDLNKVQPVGNTQIYS